MVSFKEAFALGTSLPISKEGRKKTLTTKLFESYGRVIANDIIARKALPPFDNSAMDGYAIMLADYGSSCICDGRILAGESSAGLILKKGHTYKVMTGAPLPQNTEAVVQFEWTQVEGKKVRIPAPDVQNHITQGQNIRFQGEEIAQNALLIPKGTRLNHLDLSILASQGIAHIECFAPLCVGIFSSGDEVIEPEEVATPNQIYNTNATSCYTLLKSRGYECHYGGILADDKATLKAKLEDFARYDVIITSGGASVGEADLIKEVLLHEGAEFLFSGVDIKPGRHLSIATLQGRLFILLPGNPLAMLLHLHTLILPILESMQGARAFYPRSLSLKLSQECQLKPCVSMILGTIHNDTFMLYKNGKIGSSALINMWQNNAIAICEKSHFRQGEHIKVIPYGADFCDIMDFVND